MGGLAKPDLKGGIVEISEVVDRAESRPVNVGERRLVIAGIETASVDGVGGSACRRGPQANGARRRERGKETAGERGPGRGSPQTAAHACRPARGHSMET